MRRSLLTTFLLAAFSAGAGAVGLKTQMNCASDYYAYCSQFPVGSSGVRKCMRDNGPRLSKACISALIADGEISSAEVERTRQKTLAANPKAKPEPKKVAEAPNKPAKSQTVAAIPADISPASNKIPRPLATSLVIDQKTYWALRSRARFLADPDDVQRSTVVQSVSPTDPAVPQSPAPAQTFARPGETGGVMTSATTKADRAVAGSKEPAIPASEKSKVAEDTTIPAAPSKDFSGKMSLGKIDPADQADDPEPPSQEWRDYMQSRFNGSMNFEGLGARFSKGQ